LTSHHAGDGVSSESPDVLDSEIINDQRSDLMSSHTIMLLQLIILGAVACDPNDDRGAGRAKRAPAADSASP
jgi:hypothetical protein